MVRVTATAILLATLVSCTSHAENGTDAATDAARLGDAAYQAGDWPACAEHYARASSLVPQGPSANASYNAACCFALAGDTDAAFAELVRSIDGGYRDPAHMQQDDDLASLRGDPRWKDAVDRVEAALDAYRATINVELLELFDQDQADRQGQIDWSVVGPRDDARRDRVSEIVAAGGAKVADDYYHAAMVFQHGNEPDEVWRAHEWALRAVELDPDHSSARWLAAAAQDRYLMYQDKPQKYGTQYRLVDGLWILWDVDPTTTDEERAEWNVPPIDEARRRAEGMNQGD